MKAVLVEQYGAPDVLAEQELETPRPGPNEVLIQTHAISVNFADVQRRRGRYPGGQSPPYIPGIEAAGSIVGVGPGVIKDRLGQRVVAYTNRGAYAEYVTAESRFAFHLPETLTFDTAVAGLTVGVTAFELVRFVARLRQGQSVVVMAASGGVGRMLLQFARLFGATPLIGAVGSHSKAGGELTGYCDFVVTYESASLSDELGRLLNAGVDVAFDSVGGHSTGELIRALAPFGRLVSFGQSAGRALVGTDELYPDNRSILGYNASQVRRLKPRRAVASARRLLQLLSTGIVASTITARYRLSDAAIAHQALESRRSVGKLLLVPDGII